MDRRFSPTLISMISRVKSDIYMYLLRATLSGTLPPKHQDIAGDLTLPFHLSTQLPMLSQFSTNVVCREIAICLMFHWVLSINKPVWPSKVPPVFLCFSRLPLPLLLLFSRQVMSDSLQPHGLQHTRPPCPSPISQNLPKFMDGLSPFSPSDFNLSQHQGFF